MATATYLYDGAAFQGPMKQIAIYDGSVWRDCIAVHVYDGAAWRQVFKPTLTLSGETVYSPSNGSTATAGIRVNTDGTIDSLKNATYAQIDSTTDWIVPNSAALSTDEVRVTGVTGTFTSSPGADGTWFDMSVAREWTVEQATVGTKQTTFTLEVNRAGGATEDTGAYSIESERLT